MGKMADTTLKAIVEAKLNNTLGWIGGSLQKDRQKALQFYRGDPFGNEQDGRSSVVSRDVAEAIDSAMPSLIKIFAATDTYVQFSARKPEAEEGAKQKTDYTNWVFQTQPNAFNLLQTSLKDGLMSKQGVFKSWWETSERKEPEQYEGLTTIQLQQLQQDQDFTLVESAVVGQQPPNPMMPGDDGKLWDCRGVRTNKTGNVCIEVVPPEEFLTERRTVSLYDTGFAAHRSSRSKSELIEMGFDKAKVKALASGTDALELNVEKVNRFIPEDDLSYVATNNLDPSTAKVWVAECYLKVDYNGDGIAEWRKVTLAGDGGYEILDNEECEGHPFNAWTPYLQPHKLIGESMADKVMDLQLWKSTVVREMNDGMYFNNAPQLLVIEGQANLEDVLTRRPGGVIRMKTSGAVEPLQVVDQSQSCMAAISYIDSVREVRTGIRRFTAGLNGDELNPYASTATGVNKVEDSSQDSLDLLARNYAEQALKPLFKRIAELTTKYQDKSMTVKLRGKWVNIDPSSWDDEMDATVTVGLGSGDKDKVVGQIVQMLTQIDAPIVQLQGGLSGPIITANNLYAKLNKLVEAQGFKAADNFYTDPSTAPPPPPKPDPMMAKVQGQLQLQQQKGQQDLQLKQQQGALDAQLEREKAQRQASTEAAQAQADMATQRQEAQLQAETEQRRAQHQMQLDTMKAQHQAQLDHMKAMADIAIARAKAEVDAHVKIHVAKAAAKAKPKAKPTA